MPRKDPEQNREDSRKWREANREYDRARKRKYYEEHREYYRKRYAANHEAELERGRKYRAANPKRKREWFKVNRQILYEFKSHPCVDCGNTYPPEVMDCDHVHGEKLGDLSRLVQSSQAILLAELAKCEPRCANCHRLRHANERSEAVA